jgi:hypothetical protein
MGGNITTEFKKSGGDVQWIHATQTGSSEHSNETPGSIKVRNCLTTSANFNEPGFTTLHGVVESAG